MIRPVIFAEPMRRGFGQPGIPVAKLHRPDVGAEDPDAIAWAYEEDIRRSLGPGVSLDCVLLSLGKDGHVASLFPGRAATFETDRLVVPEVDSPKPPHRRVTMTLPLDQSSQARASRSGRAPESIGAEGDGDEGDGSQTVAGAGHPTDGRAAEPVGGLGGGWQPSGRVECVADADCDRRRSSWFRAEDRASAVADEARTYGL